DVATIADPGETAAPPAVRTAAYAAGEQPPPVAAPAANGAADDAQAATRTGTLTALDRKGNVRTLAEVELEMIRFAIDHYRGQMSEVARRLGIGRSTLYRKLKEYGIDPETGRAEKSPQ